MSVRRQPPPPGLIAAAEQDYHAARDDLDRIIAAVRAVLASDFSEIEAVTDVWRSPHVQQNNPVVLLLSAAAIVRLAKASPVPARGTGWYGRRPRRVRVVFRQQEARVEGASS